VGETQWDLGFGILFNWFDSPSPSPLPPGEGAGSPSPGGSPKGVLREGRG
jgi:hypothetical protein